MKKKIMSLALVLVFISVLPLTGQAAEKVFKWKYISVPPVAHPTGRIMADAVKKIAERSQGRLIVEFVSYMEAPYKGNEALRLVRDGLFEGVEMLNGYCTGDAPLLSAVELPFMLPNYIQDVGQFYATYDKVWSNPKVSQAMQKVWDKYNSVPMGRFYYDPQVLSTRKGKEVKGPADLKGLQIREYSAEGADMLKSIGATAAIMTAKEVYTALQRGMCDGVMAGCFAVKIAKWYEVLNHWYIWNVKASASHVLFNKAKVKQLPPDLKQILKEEIAAGCKKVNENMAKMSALCEESFVKEAGWTMHYPSQEDWAYLRNLAKKEAWPKWVKRVGPQGKALLNTSLKVLGDAEGLK